MVRTTAELLIDLVIGMTSQSHWAITAQVITSLDVATLMQKRGSITSIFP